MRAVKAGRQASIDYALDRLKVALDDTGLAEFFGPDVTLVPVPRSAPLSSPTALWPGRVICRGLVSRDLGTAMLPCLSRLESVQRSSTAAKGERPDPEAHLRTIAIEPEILTTKRITLVDDVVTIGRTILAAASHVRAAYPDADIRAFGLIHTAGQGKEIAGIAVPYIGRLVRRGRSITHDPER
jgi:hypothetical protein